MTKTRICISISVVLYMISLFLPAFDCGEGSRASWLGYEVLERGWLGIIALEPRCYANILYVYCVVLGAVQKKYKPNPYIVFFLFISTVSSPFFPGWVSCPSVDTMTSAEGLAVGGYLWVCAITLVIIPYLPDIISYIPEWKTENH